MVTTYTVNQTGPATPDGTTKSLVVDLPPGLVGNPRAVPTCDIARVRAFPPDGCPMNTAVGYAVTEAAFPAFGFSDTFTTLIYNITPDKGEPAAFAFAITFNTVRLSAGVRSGSDYGIRISAENLSERLYLLSGTVTFWGVPGDHTGPGPLTDSNTQRPFGGPSDQLRKPFLSNPTSCDGAPSAVMSATTVRVVWLSGLLQITSQTGCPVCESGAWSEMRSTAWFAASADRIRCTTYAAVWIPVPGAPGPAWPGVTDPAGLVPADERPAPPGELPDPDWTTATAVTAAATAAAAALAASSGPRRPAAGSGGRAGRAPPAPR